MLAAVALKPLRGGEAIGFRELLYLRVVGRPGARVRHCSYSVAEHLCFEAPD